MLNLLPAIAASSSHGMSSSVGVSGDRLASATSIDRIKQEAIVWSSLSASKNLRDQTSASRAPDKYALLHLGPENPSDRCRRGRRRAPPLSYSAALSVLLVYIVEVDGPPSPPDISAFPSPSFVAASTAALFIDLTAIPPVFIEGLRIAAFKSLIDSAVSFSSKALTVLRQSSKARIALWL